MKKKIGLIGLGNIGSFYTDKILEAGYPLTVFDTDNKKLQAMADKGAVSVTSPAQVTENADIIILSLPNSEVVEAVMEDANGVLSAIKAGQLVIDTSTCRPNTAIRCQKLCAKKNAGFIDAPLSRRELGHTLMVGGDEKDYKNAEEILKCISARCKLVGPIGYGQRLKAINQAVMANRLAVDCEAFELCKMCGIDPKLLNDHLEFGLPEVLFTEDYPGGGNLVLHYKDMGYLNEIAHDVHANIPISALVHEMFKASKLYGDPSWIQAGIQTYFKRLNSGE